MRSPAELPRRTIEELALRYELEPTMRDVFVEGHSDQTILRWFIDSCCSGGESVGVFPIDEIDVPSEVLQQYKMSSGNRSEVIALCLELERRFGDSLTSVTGVVDLDIFGIIPGDHQSGLLVKSDFSCLEIYLFSEQSLAKTLKLAFPHVKKSAKEVTDELAPVLRELFLLRAGAHGLGFSAEWISYDSFLSVEGGVLKYRLKDHQRHYLQKSGVWERRGELDKAITELRAKLPGDFRFEANGHDAICVLGHYLKAFYKKVKDVDRTCPHVLAYILTCSLEIAEALEQPMFQKLLQRVG
jgi:hypothetical protein